ncbi:MAG: hypothetical protein QOE17_1305 [Gaiellales bacterium]|nr:hypothetical protein [Gaiellales bacterium]
MSAVIWFGIVAVWAFVLIPTWVRRSDIHWRRSGETPTRDKLGRAARVITRAGSASSRASTVPHAHRSATPGRRTVTESYSSPHSSEDLPSPEGSPGTDTLTATETAPPAQGPPAAEPEAPMTTPRSPRPIPHRTAPHRSRARAGTQQQPPHVQRARRLVWFGSTALATLLLALILGGWWFAIHLVADIALVGYLRHLRGVAREQQAARRARTSGAREPAPSSVRRATAPTQVQRRSAPVRHPAEPTPRVSAPAQTAPEVSPTAEPVEVIDVTDSAMTDDCPTTELMAARAV